MRYSYTYPARGYTDPACSYGYHASGHSYLTGSHIYQASGYSHLTGSHIYQASSHSYPHTGSYTYPLHNPVHGCACRLDLLPLHPLPGVSGYRQRLR